MNSKAIKNKYDFVVIFDIERATLGDNGLGEIGRTDIVGMVREYVRQAKDGVKGYEIYAENIHRQRMEKAYNVMLRKHDNRKTRQNTPLDRQLQKWLCRNFFDLRAFGADLTVGENPGGHLAETVQFDSAVCADPALVSRGDGNENGAKVQASYTIYKLEGMVSAILAEKTSFSNGDLELLWQAIENIFGENGTIARMGGISKITLRKLVTFKHKSALGNAQPHDLCGRVSITRKNTDGSNTNTASGGSLGYSNYDIKIDRAGLPATVEIFEKDLA